MLKADLFEAIIGLPENLFAGTGIPATVLILNNAKAPERRGKVRLFCAVGGRRAPAARGHRDRAGSDARLAECLAQLNPWLGKNGVRRDFATVTRISAVDRTTIEPNGFKAHIVTASRDVAVTYVEALRKLGAPECALIMSSSNGDSARLQAHHLSKREREDRIARFKRRDDPLKMLVVCDMLITGFGAPIEQVLYLDAPLREHTLLQAIARVNRIADGKTYGLVVDYWGDNRRISNALALFSEEDGAANALRSLSEKVQLLESRHRAALRVFEGVDRMNEAACLALLDREDVRAKFELDLLRFADAMDMALPDPKALDEPYVSDLKWLARLRVVARRAHYQEPFDQGLRREGRSDHHDAAVGRERGTASCQARYSRSRLHAAISTASRPLRRRQPKSSMRYGMRSTSTAMRTRPLMPRYGSSWSRS